MNDKKNTKSYLTKMIILIISFIVIGISGTYAYFTMTTVGNPTETRATAGVFKVISSLENANAINNTRLRLIDNVDKETKAEKVTFTVTSLPESTVDARYYIRLKNIEISKNLYSSYMKWEIAKTTGEVLAKGDFSQLSRDGEPLANEENNVLTNAKDLDLTTSTQTTTGEDGLVLVKKTQETLLFRIWLENDPNINQIDLMEGNFSGKLFLEAVPISELNSQN